MYLLTGDDLRTSLGLANVDSIQIAADRAVVQATLHLESDLRTPLSLQDYSDVWLLRPDEFTLQMLALKLTAGFVDSTSLVIGCGSTMALALDDDSLTESAVLNDERGMLTLAYAELSTFISVRYTAGFDVSGTDDQLFDAALTPEWLRQAAQIKGSQLLASDPDLETAKSKILDAMSLTDQYGSLVTPRVRYFPMARNPLA